MYEEQQLTRSGLIGASVSSKRYDTRAVRAKLGPATVEKRTRRAARDERGGGAIFFDPSRRAGGTVRFEPLSFLLDPS